MWLSSFCQELLRKERRGRREKEEGERKRKERGGKKGWSKKNLESINEQGRGDLHSRNKRKNPLHRKGKGREGSKKACEGAQKREKSKAPGRNEVEVERQREGCQFLLCVGLCAVGKERARRERRNKKKNQEDFLSLACQKFVVKHWLILDADRR